MLPADARFHTRSLAQRKITDRQGRVLSGFSEAG